MAKDKSETVTFHYRIAGGEECHITVATGVYVLAAMAIPAMTGRTDLPLEIEIWCPKLLSEHGPYRYEIYYNEFGWPQVRYLVS